MIPLVIVTVVLNGVVVPATRPARIIEGTIMVPLDPIVIRFARVAAFDAAAGTIVVEGRHGRVRLRLDSRQGRGESGPVLLRTAPYAVDSTAFVPLAPVVTALGGQLRYDGFRKVAEVLIVDVEPVRTPEPFDPTAPRVAPHTVFTQQPIPTPQPTLTGVPHPRRTPIEVGTP